MLLMRSYCASAGDPLYCAACHAPGRNSSRFHSGESASASARPRRPTRSAARSARCSITWPAPRSRASSGWRCSTCSTTRRSCQALLQVLQGQWDPTFSEHSYGFRPGRSAHQAVAQAQQYIAAGYNVVVDLDLGKFFDRVNHDSLMARVATRVTDKRVLKLIRAFLKAGVMEDGLVSPVDE